MDINKARAKRRLRRRRHIRKQIFGKPERPRLTVTRSHRHIHCQVIDDFKGATLFSASSLAKEIRDQVGTDGGNVKGATLVGTLIAQRAKQAGIQRLSFDRNGYRYHGRVAALAEAVRKEGIEV